MLTNWVFAKLSTFLGVKTFSDPGSASWWLLLLPQANTSQFELSMLETLRINLIKKWRIERTTLSVDVCISKQIVTQAQETYDVVQTELHCGWRSTQKKCYEIIEVNFRVQSLFINTRQKPCTPNNTFNNAFYNNKQQRWYERDLLD